jgi:nucleoside-diphosphate-sugar epimerase
MSAMSASHVVLGAGPVGRAVVAALTSRGIDLADPVQAGESVAGAEVVFQCAQPAYHRWPEEFPALQARAVAAATSAGALLVVAENLYGYGPVPGPLTQDLPLTATTRKGAVRAQMWRDLQAAHQAGRLRMVAGRAADFFGPGVEDSAVGRRFFGPLAGGKVVRVVGDPDRLHTYTYVPDFGEALVRLSATPEAWGQAWHVPNAPTVTTRALAEQAADLAGTTLRLRGTPRWQLRLLGRFVPAVGELVEMLYEFDEDFVVDHTPYATLLGDHATPLDEALAATLG